MFKSGKIFSFAHLNDLMAKRPEKELDFTTEEKIKNAARKLFIQKGFAATRTRDISEEAGINLALLNYYFRSKEKLFELVMMESLQHFFKGMIEILNQEHTSIEEKIDVFVARYTALLLQQPDIPLFIFHELRMNPHKLASKMGAKSLIQSYFIKQLQGEVKRGKLPPFNPLHIIMNMVGMIVFPFIAAPVLREIAGLDQKDYNTFIQDRRTMIPKWIKAIMKVK